MESRLNFRCSQELQDEIDRLAGELSISRSQAIRWLLCEALESTVRTK